MTMTLNTNAPSVLNTNLTHKGSEEASQNDLLWWDSANHCVRSAEFFADAGTAAATQAAFAALFAGISKSAQDSTDSTGRIARVIVDTVMDFDCESSTYAIGNYVAPV